MRAHAWTMMGVAAITCVMSGAEQELPPPTNIRVLRLETERVVLAWTRPPGFDGQFIDYLVEHAPTGEFFAIATFQDGQEFGLPANTTFRLTFRSHLTASDTFSRPSAPIVFTTPARPPVTGLRAALQDGNTVVLDWNEPVPPTGLRYLVLNDGVVETSVDVTDNTPPSSPPPTAIALPRMQAGRTHVFTVRYSGSADATVSIDIPGTGDTTPPTPPANLVTAVRFDRYGIPFEVTSFEPATDDTTPQADITYELLVPELTPPGPLRVEDYDVVSPVLRGPATHIRAVDASGNRSAAVPLPPSRR